MTRSKAQSLILRRSRFEWDIAVYWPAKGKVIANAKHVLQVEQHNDELSASVLPLDGF